MANSLTIPDPKWILGITLLAFSGWLAVEGGLMMSIPQLLIAIIVFTAGWQLRKRGTIPLCVSATSMHEWIRFCAIATPALLTAYVVCYFVLMDRHRPTSPAAAYTRFDSSLRWASREWVDKALTPYETPWGSVTTWNILYQPMDCLWFHFFPRPKEEVESLRALGYYN